MTKSQYQIQSLAENFRFGASRAGFTLIELAVYVALLTVVAAITVNTVVMLNRAFILFRLERRMTSSAEIAMRRITREVRLASEVYASSTLGISPGVLSMAGKESEEDAAPKDAMFYVDANVLMFRKATSSAIALTGNGVTVVSIVFSRIANGETSEAVKVDLVVRAAFVNASTTRSYHTTTVLRGSY